MQYRVYLNNSLLKNIPNGINDLTFNYSRDNKIFGIYIVQTLELVFPGDGYCLLSDLSKNTQICSIPVRIELLCKNTYKVIFNGIIDIGDLKLNHSSKQGTATIQDNSPLALLSSNADISFDFDSTKDVFGNEVFTPSYAQIDMFDEVGDFIYEDRPMVSLSNVIEKLVKFTTGKNVKVETQFFTSQGASQHYRIQFSSDPVVSQVTTVKYTNFWGEKRQFILPFAFSAEFHLRQTALAFTENNMGNPVSSTAVRRDLRQFRERGMTKSEVDVPANTIDVYTPVPFTDVEVITTSTGGPTVTFELLTEIDDKVFNPYLLNYSMLINVDPASSPYKFQLTFKGLMTELNKLCNCFFVAVYDGENTNKIIFIIEDESFFLDKPPIYTFDTVKDLTVDFLEDNIYSEINVGSNQSQNSTLANDETLTSLFCGVKNTFNAKSDFVIDSVQIFVDLAEEIDTNTIKKDIYLIQVNDTNDEAQIYGISAGDATCSAYNGQLNNNLTIMRHFSKFKNNIIGSPNKEIINTSNIKLYTKYVFKQILTFNQFKELTLLISGMIKFKTDEMTEYFRGIITNIEYKFESGEALITVLGS